MTDSLKRRGTCHLFGDDIPLDDGVMPFKYAIGRVTDPQALIPHLFENIDAGFASRVRPGDIILAGRNFGCGKAHMQGFIAMASLGMGVLCDSMPYKSHRGAIARGVPVLTGCIGLASFAATGEEIEIDFSSGEAINFSRGTRTQFLPLPEILADLVAQGGLRGALQRYLESHPEMSEALDAGARRA